CRAVAAPSRARSRSSARCCRARTQTQWCRNSSRHSDRTLAASCRPAASSCSIVSPKRYCSFDPPCRFSGTLEIIGYIELVAEHLQQFLVDGPGHHEIIVGHTARLADAMRAVFALQPGFQREVVAEIYHVVGGGERQPVAAAV